jgi:hypothetical protein
MRGGYLGRLHYKHRARAPGSHFRSPNERVFYRNSARRNGNGRDRGKGVMGRGQSRESAGTGAKIYSPQNLRKASNVTLKISARWRTSCCRRNVRDTSSQAFQGQDPVKFSRRWKVSQTHHRVTEENHIEKRRNRRAVPIPFLRPGPIGDDWTEWDPAVRPLVARVGRGCKAASSPGRIPPRLPRFNPLPLNGLAKDFQRTCQTRTSRKILTRKTQMSSQWTARKRNRRRRTRHDTAKTNKRRPRQASQTKQMQSRGVPLETA